MSTADHPQTYGQTERVIRVVEDVLRSVCAERHGVGARCSPFVELALDNAVNASTSFTPFNANGIFHPRVPLNVPRSGSGLGGGGLAGRLTVSVQSLFANRLMRFSPCV